MNQSRYHITLEDLHICKTPEGLCNLFSRLGYAIETEIISLPKETIGFAPADATSIRQLFLLANQVDTRPGGMSLQVILFELEEIAMARLRSLAGNFLNRGGNYLLVGTTDYRRIIFVNPRREGGRVRVRKLVVDTAYPTRHDLDILEGLAVEKRDPQALYQAHCAAFDVERVTNRFYQEYAELFQRVQQALVDHNRGIQDFYDPARLHAFTQRLLGRIMFLYFIQKKGWLAGDTRFLTRQYRQTIQDEGNYYALVLEPLFFETLNKRRPNDESRWGRIPYLNGGLFEKDYEFIFYLPNELFDSGTDTGILGFFNNYNFTIAEDTPSEQEVAVDPEMLGKVFENMMESQERGTSGTFYTPRPIVHYMCRETLLGYLQEQTGLEIGLLTAQFEDEPGKLLTVSQAHQVEDALNRLRVLDPAVGTGAFLVGILHELITIKRACFLAQHVDVSRSSALAASWKRQYIGQTLYGVDIKPEAIEIARLRLWLSLVVDLELDQIEPLPNLDFKLRTGDSLRETIAGELILPDLGMSERTGITDPNQHNLPGIQAPQQLGLNIDPASQARQELSRLKDAFFVCQDAEQRQKLRHRIELQELQVILGALDGKLADLDTQIKRIVDKGSLVNWRFMAREQRELEGLIQKKQTLLARREEIEYGRNMPFLYRLHFAEVFQYKSGFDIVIANPPYVRMELIKDLKPELRLLYPSVYDGRADLYIYFYARGIDLLRVNGTLAFISSNKYMRAGYGEGLRRILGEQTTLQALIDFGDLPVFEAIAYPSIAITKKSPPPSNHSPKVIVVENIGTLEKFDEEMTEHSWALPQIELKSSGWTLGSNNAINLITQLRDSGTPLETFVSGKFFTGIKTGLNEGFIIDSETKKRLIEHDSNSAQVIRPWLRGRDVKRWRIETPDAHIIFTYHGIDITKYPAIYEYLLPFKERLEARATSKLHKWFELQQPQTGIYQSFEKPKIIWPDIAPVCTFTIDDQGYYLDMTLFVIPTSNLYLVGILNSRVSEWFLRNTSPTIQQGFLRFKRTYMSKLPIPRAKSGDQLAIENLVRELMTLRGQGIKSTQLEEELNERVYLLFGLGKNEIKIIEEVKLFS